jgi:hypothetical protein
MEWGLKDARRALEGRRERGTGALQRVTREEGGGDGYLREEEQRHHKDTAPVVSPNTPSSRLPKRVGCEGCESGSERSLLARSGYSEG